MWLEKAEGIWLKNKLFSHLENTDLDLMHAYSISHQLQRNGEFISRNLSGSILTGEYCDNGVSGTTFVEVR